MTQTGVVETRCWITKGFMLQSFPFDADRQDALYPRRLEFGSFYACRAGVMPLQKDFVAAGRYDLKRVVERWGGSAELAAVAGYKARLTLLHEEHLSLTLCCQCHSEQNDACILDA